MKRSRGQALIEFALVSPILLLLIMGIFDFSRAFITYAITSNSLRSALRMAEVRGIADSSGAVASAGYTDCAGMRTMARNVLFAQPPSITIEYLDATSPLASPTKFTCYTHMPTMDRANVKNGDILRINVSATVNFITPLISTMWPSLTLDFSGQRTIVSQIQLGAAANVAADSDFDGLNDAWEIRWFGNLSQSATDDPDSDGCNNGCEETRNSNPTLSDTDGDGIPDGQEAGCQLDPNNSSANDVDGDGLDANLECVLGLDDNNPDWDGDGLSDGYEYYTSRTNPALADSDGDGLDDGYEVTHSSNPLARDTDRDGLWDRDEVRAGTLISVADSDSDGLLDGEEVGFSDGSYAGTGTNPLMADTDGDQLNDGYELLINDSDPRVMDADDTNPLLPDTDGDGLSDNLEILLFHTNPRIADTDGDTLNDSQEVYGTFFSATCGAVLAPTNPLVADTDSDGLRDDVDCESNYDTDRDGLLDAWEYRYFPGNLLALSGADDTDSDGCDNFCEQTFDTSPVNPDSDGDGLLDGLETVQPWSYTYPRTNPLNADTDGDGIIDGDEIANNTDPWNRDTDSDGLTDFQELRALPFYNGIGTSPVNADSDSDGLKDGEEVNFASRGYSVTVNGVTMAVTSALNPMNADSDNDGLLDGQEVLIWRTNPLNPDTDGDGLSDGSQELMNGDTDPLIMDSNDTDPLVADTDGDGLTDGEERNIYGTNPRDTDSDDDTLTDGYEVNFTSLPITVNGTTSTVACTLNPLNPDKDGDGVNDGAEVNRAGGSTNPCNADTDGDGLCDGAFVVAGTCAMGGEINRSITYTVNENVTRTVTISTDPLRTDTDRDGINDKQEIDGTRVVGGRVAITDPVLLDTDADGVNDDLDAYPNWQPTLRMILCTPDCSPTEPTTTTRAYQAFRFQVDFVNSGTPYIVNYLVTPVSSSIEYRVAPRNSGEVCSTDGSQSFDFKLVEQESWFQSFSSTDPSPTNRNVVEICRDNRVLNQLYSGIVRDPGTPATENFTVDFFPASADTMYVAPGTQLSFPITLNNR